MDDLEQRREVQHRAWLEQERHKQRLHDLYQAAVIAAAHRLLHRRAMNAAEIAASLTKAQREALLALSAEYQAGPDLPESCWPELKALQHNGLVERDFADWQDKTIIRYGVYERRLSACWWYRLTPLGLAVRAILQAKEPTDER